MWITQMNYSLRYMGVVNQLLATLDMANDYVCIHEYANHALQVVPSNADAHYWHLCNAASGYAGNCHETASGSKAAADHRILQ